MDWVKDLGESTGERRKDEEGGRGREEEGGREGGGER